MTAFAAFILVPVGNGFAATTRPSEKGKIGLPGGKVENFETEKQAARREAFEEGWNVSGILVEIHRQVVDGNEVVWFSARKATQLEEYKEMHRLSTVVVSKMEIANSGFGNEFILTL